MLTTQGRLYVALMAVRDHWQDYSPEQRAEVADIVNRLNQALRNENPQPRRPMQMVGRITA